MNEVAQESRVDQKVIDAIREVVMIARYFVDNPDEVDVNIDCQGYTVVVGLSTNRGDVGQVVGRNAHIITSMRSFLSAIGGKNDIKVILDYITEQDNRRNVRHSDDGRNRRF